MANFEGKAYPLHTDTLAYFPDNAAIAAVVERGRDIESVNGPMEGKFAPRPTYPRYYRKHKAQFNDPVVVYYVLDLLSKQQRGTYIRPNYLINPLRDAAPLYDWSARSLGRLLSGLHGACLDEYPGLGSQKVPFAKGRDAKGTYYVMDPLGGDECVFWLLNLRKRAMQMAEALMIRESTGDLDHSLGIPENGPDFQRDSQPVNLYSVHWFNNTAVRSVEHYLAQADSQPFFRSAPATKGGSIRDPLAV